MALSDRVLLVKIAGKSINIYIMQVYALTGDLSDEVKETYNIMGQALRQCKSREIIIGMGGSMEKFGKDARENVRGNTDLVREMREETNGWNGVKR